MNRRTGQALFLSLLAGVVLVVLASCGTVTQRPVESKETGSYVAPVRQPDGSYLVDDDFRARYNGLIAIYGRKHLENGAPVFVPALVPDGGISPVRPGWWRMTPRAIEDMRVLSELKRRGAAP